MRDCFAAKFNRAEMKTGARKKWTIDLATFLLFMLNLAAASQLEQSSTSSSRICRRLTGFPTLVRSLRTPKSEC